MLHINLLTAHRWSEPPVWPQPELFEPTHEGLHPDRFDRAPERVYARRWREYNRQHHTLAHILTPSSGRKASIFGGVRQPTQLEATVAACVVQWLGTNVGRGFVLQCEREATALSRAADRLSEGPWYYGQPEEGDPNYLDADAVLRLATEPWPGPVPRNGLRFAIACKFWRLRREVTSQRATRKWERDLLVADHVKTVEDARCGGFVAGVDYGVQQEQTARRLRTTVEAGPRAIAIREDE